MLLEFSEKQCIYVQTLLLSHRIQGFPLVHSSPQNSRAGGPGATCTGGSQAHGVPKGQPRDTVPRSTGTATPCGP